MLIRPEIDLVGEINEKPKRTPDPDCAIIKFHPAQERLP
jgi:hypothetical protein